MRPENKCYRNVTKTRKAGAKTYDNGASCVTEKMNVFRRKPRGFALFQAKNSMFRPSHPHQTQKKDGRRARRRSTQM